MGYAEGTRVVDGQQHLMMEAPAAWTRHLQHPNKDDKASLRFPTPSTQFPCARLAWPAPLHAVSCQRHPTHALLDSRFSTLSTPS